MIAYVESPFQYLQVVEYLWAHDMDPADVRLLVRKTKIKANNQQIRNTIHAFNMSYANVAYVRNWVFLIVYGIWISFQKQTNSQILIGDENSFFTKVLRFFVSTDRLVYLDDGTATLERTNQGKRFSMFAENGEEKNSFERMASYMRSIEAGKKQVIVMVGAKFIESKISTLDEYTTYLQQIVEDLRQEHPSKTILYIPHRYEGQNLPILKRKIFDPANIDVQRLQFPIEMIRMELKVEVSMFVSFFSTALFSLEHFYPESHLRYYVIPMSHIRVLQHRVKLIYDRLDASSFEKRQLRIGS